MTLELFTLCEYASNTGGKLTIVNTLDTITAEKFPWRAYFGFALKGIIKHEHPSDSKISLSILKEDNNLAIFETTFPIIDKVGRFAAAANLRGLIFEQEGRYIFRVSNTDGLCVDYQFTVTLPKSNSTINEN